MTAVLFRTDASSAIGSGHVFRCLALAERLTAHGLQPTFAAREMPPSLAARIEGAGYSLHRLPADDGVNSTPAPHAAWLSGGWSADAAATAALATTLQPSAVVVDHYALDAAWEAKVGNATGRPVAVLDDLADRRHAAALIVDPTQSERSEARYQGLLTGRPKCLLGPAYVILRPAFEAPPKRAAAPGTRLRWLVAFGGVDLAGMTAKSLQALLALQANDQAIVVIGGENPAKDALADEARRHGWQVVIDAPEMAPLMAAADVGVGAGGLGLWERLAMGLPSVAISVASNQADQVRAAHDAGLAIGLDARSLTALELAGAMRGLAAAPTSRAAMAAKGQALVDGKGAQRVAAAVAEISRAR